jgi:hypothetical protein
MKTPQFFTSALYGSEWSVSHPGRVTSAEEPRYLLDRRLGGPIADLDPAE